MRFDHLHYVPCLRWKQGEYQAIWRSPAATKSTLTPLLEVPEIGWDFELQKENKTIDEHLAPFAKRVNDKWGRSSCFVDLNLIGPNERMSDGTHPVCFIFNELRAKNCSAIPVTDLSKDTQYQREIKSAVGKGKTGVCLRISIEQAAKSSFKKDIQALLLALNIQSTECDFILDLRSPNFIPLDGFLKAIHMIVSGLPYLKKWRTFTLLGTSFPSTMAEVRKEGELIPRYEWQLYKKLVIDFHDSGLRLPAFGDYVISHPQVLRLDMRLVKPSATIRYAVDNNWYIVKGNNVRDYGFEQYRKLSKQIQNSRHFCGSTFSWGDSYIQQCADGDGKTGNLMMWRQVGTNHHIEKLLQDIASFYAS